jgi:hypothetical protein
MSGTGQIRSIEARAIDAHVRAVVREMLAENATPAEKPEEPAVTTFDFGDGYGAVPAEAWLEAQSTDEPSAK